MQSEVRPLRELCSLIADCPHSTPVWTDAGYIVIRNQNIKNGRLDLSSSSFTDAQHFEQRIRRAKPRGGDIIFTREAPMGQVCMIPKGLECCLGQRQVLLRPNPAVVDSRFLLYALQSPQVQHEIGWNEGTGSTVSNVRIPVLESLNIPTPCLKVQKEIAAVLGAIDDRIDVLCETNITLEAIAQTVFKSWFIDFDPVRAKTEGREPEGMDAKMAELFPHTFANSALGAIPAGWRVSHVGQEINCVGGGTPSTQEGKYWEPAIHYWTTPKDLSRNTSPVLLSTERRLSDAGLAKVSSGLLPAGTLLMSSRAPIGYLAIAQIPLAVNQGYIAMLPDGNLPPQYLYFWCKENMDSIKQKANGSTFMEISKSIFRQIPLIVPPRGIVECFMELSGSVFDRITAGEKQRLSLQELRDSLLPRLISGEVRVPEGEAQLNEALA
ncbi:restriction endonuclease subunit S [Cupriavidus cauae]|uniref:Restriction endonuclease subunit S n=1 Tax=Cupriavidus cauae TaxID=2608999 RepID=A0A5M8AKM9_9BURK|nr:restriction endonuclease subunit S [Cupriavidus cauae]KAA6124497.1 restriction endonuclease subunit S [Cupriavidus cauae]